MCVKLWGSLRLRRSSHRPCPLLREQATVIDTFNCPPEPKPRKKPVKKPKVG